MKKTANLLFSLLYRIYNDYIIKTDCDKKNMHNITQLLSNYQFDDENQIKNAINSMTLPNRQLLINLLSTVFDEKDEIIILLKTIPIEQLPHGIGLNLPKYATVDSACFDLLSTEDITLKAQTNGLISTGIKIAFPVGSVGYLFIRSGVAVKNNIVLTNGVGVIDADYRGEIKVALSNISQKDYNIQRGDRIAQLMIMPYNQVILTKHDNLTDFATTRDSGGFGSTGKN